MQQGWRRLVLEKMVEMIEKRVGTLEAMATLSGEVQHMPEAVLSEKTDPGCQAGVRLRSSSDEVVPLPSEMGGGAPVKTSQFATEAFLRVGRRGPESQLLQHEVGPICGGSRDQWSGDADGIGRLKGGKPQKFCLEHACPLRGVGFDKVIAQEKCFIDASSGDR